MAGIRGPSQAGRLCLGDPWGDGFERSRWRAWRTVEELGSCVDGLSWAFACWAVRVYRWWVYSSR